MLSRGTTTWLVGLVLALNGSLAATQVVADSVGVVEAEFSQTRKTRALDTVSCLDWIQRLYAIAGAEDPRSDANFDALVLVLDISQAHEAPETQTAALRAIDRIAAGYGNDVQKVGPLLEAYFDNAELVSRIRDWTASPAVEGTILTLEIEEVIDAGQAARIPDEDATRALRQCMQLEAEYFGLKGADGRVFTERVAGDRYQLENLRLEMIAPDISGEDLDGLDFKLSDYRGQVVMLSFWGSWSERSRSQYAHERSLVNRLRNEPFALIGVNSDVDRQALKPLLAKEQITWRSFWNGPAGIAGPISKSWNVKRWPTVYVLDHEGRLRYKGTWGSSADEAVDALVAALKAGV